MSFKLWMTRQHYQPGKIPSPWLWPLLPFSLFYELAVRIRLTAYQYGLLKSYQAPVPVISIGNLTTGGTGKTPIVIAIAKGLVQSGKTVVILSRGYGAEEKIAYSRALDPRYGDEAYLIQEQVPEAIVIVGKNRVQNLRRALHDYRPDYVILDDGYQHVQLERDMNILLIDGQRLLGNGFPLPVGPIREPLREIARANLIFVTKAVSQTSMETVENWVRQYGPIPPKAPIQIMPIPFQPVGLRPMADFKSLQSHNTSLTKFINRPTIAFSALAQSGQFEKDLRALGLKVLKHFQFEDHHVYTSANVDDILAYLAQQQPQNPILVTTDKDLTKLRRLLPESVQDRVYTLQMVPMLDGRWFYDEFITQIHGHIYSGAGHVQSSNR
ncbi:tetraacyldisaccharide 4'-kinase [Vampirovibrio sp.]|uniref:tetraacyldisaccharide 4'-kinase n=1 Tax=Vampirovibrio sp. TaxID=2717857 RepID=UPI0035939CE1